MNNCPGTKLDFAGFWLAGLDEKLIGQAVWTNIKSRVDEAQSVNHRLSYELEKALHEDVLQYILIARLLLSSPKRMAEALPILDTVIQRLQQLSDQLRPESERPPLGTE